MSLTNHEDNHCFDDSRFYCDVPYVMAELIYDCIDAAAADRMYMFHKVERTDEGGFSK